MAEPSTTTPVEAAVPLYVALEQIDAVEQVLASLGFRPRLRLGAAQEAMLSRLFPSG